MCFLSRSVKTLEKLRDLLGHDNIFYLSTDWLMVVNTVSALRTFLLPYERLNPTAV